MAFSVVRVASCGQPASGHDRPGAGDKAFFMRPSSSPGGGAFPLLGAAKPEFFSACCGACETR
jgi:hypothetical protein